MHSTTVACTLIIQTLQLPQQTSKLYHTVQILLLLLLYLAGLLVAV